jgi:glutamine synthetase
MMKSENVGERRRHSRGYSTAPGTKLERARLKGEFGSLVFTDDILVDLMPQPDYQDFVAKRNRVRLDDHLIESYARCLKQWALENNATHWTHSFLPLNDQLSSKQDAFLSIDPEQKQAIIISFSGKDLRQSEPDASSFPSADSRPTHQARGYAIWDQTIPPYILSFGTTRTLYIPSLYFGWNGVALDRRIPLQRSESRVHAALLNLLATIGEDVTNQTAFTSLGLEQEFFLIDRKLFLRRPDLMVAGRTLIGKPSAKGQQLSDHYFTDLGHRSQCMDDINRDLWQLGIPIVTRHKEVAPGQYEMAPHFESGPIAAYHNSMLLRSTEQVARRHGLVALFHEKPFEGLNGSARHANYSVNSTSHPQLFKIPKFGEKPPLHFLLAMTAAT